MSLPQEGQWRGVGHRIAAVVAHQPAIGTVVGQGNAAMRAADHFMAGLASGKGVITPAIEQQNGLPAPLEVFLQGEGQRLSKGGIHRRGVLVHVHQFHLGQHRLAKTVTELVEPKLFLLGHPCGFHRGSGGGKQAKRPLFPAAVTRHFPGIVPGAGFGLIGVLLFLVDDHKPQMVHRGKHRRPGPHHNGGFAATDPFPFIQALPQESPLWNRAMPSPNHRRNCRIV